MEYLCPKCHSDDIVRHRRKGIFDQLFAIFACWPYWCRACHSKFRMRRRYLRQELPTFEAYYPRRAGTQHAGPRKPYKTDAVRPNATIFVEAETHQQLDAILLALSQAVDSHHKKAVKCDAGLKSETKAASPI